MLRRALVVGPVVAWALACASPTLPLPPPEAPTVQPGLDADHVELVAGCGGAEIDALIVAVNRNPTVPQDQQGASVFANGCGAWRASIYGHKGDPIDITQDYGGVASPPTSIIVR